MEPRTAMTTVRFASAGLFVEKLAAGEFLGLGTALEDDAKLDALLPRGFVQWEGRAAVCDAFHAFFGGMDHFEVMDATVGQIGDRLQLRWRIRARGDRTDHDMRVVEQSCFADTGPTERLRYLALVCSGYRNEQVDV